MVVQGADAIMAWLEPLNAYDSMRLKIARVPLTP
jgi:hypothetical protein